jgi:hypothetical protein
VNTLAPEHLHIQTRDPDAMLEKFGADAMRFALAYLTTETQDIRMPVEFAVAAYRFGHSMIRDNYFVNFNFMNASLGQVFEFIRKPRLPVFSNWVVDFNAFFDTGVVVPVNNKARKIDSVLASGLETLPGFSGLMQILATRNLRRGLALGLPSGQGMAGFFGMTPMTTARTAIATISNPKAMTPTVVGRNPRPAVISITRPATCIGPMSATLARMTDVSMPQVVRSGTNWKIRADWAAP